ncbi:hypothetical protein GIB67_041593 [Kingdonia uniflora]|uniref:Uncharacterized protein n=1 Tax=Kingdonia uniflora TaxID=39325 RepID=A0A7J7MQT6_9MAGN|nr:hypothetical protein GIB67_041593 [Kingdonia uniflora]
MEVSLYGSNSLPDGVNDYIYENAYGGDFGLVGPGKCLVLSGIEYEQARKWLIGSHPHFDDWKRFMDSNTTTGNDILGSVGRAKKKWGPYRGPASLPDGRKRNVSVNHLGQPNGVDEDTIAFVTNVGVSARTDIPIIYDDIRLVPAYFTNRILKKLEASSARNKVNQSKLKAPICVGRRSLPVIHHMLAMKRKLNSNALVARSEVHLTTHTKRDSNVQCPELAEKIMAIERLEPHLKFASVDDSLAKALQKKENQGRIRGLGVGVCPIVMKKTKYLIRQNEFLRSENLRLHRLGVAHHQNHLWDHVNIHHRYRLSKVLSKDRGVSHGEVVAVDPDTLVHNVLLGNGFYKIFLSKVMKPRTLLSKYDGYSKDLGDVGEETYVAWAIWCLEFDK